MGTFGVDESHGVEDLGVCGEVVVDGVEDFPVSEGEGFVEDGVLDGASLRMFGG